MHSITLFFYNFPCGLKLEWSGKKKWLKATWWFWQVNPVFEWQRRCTVEPQLYKMFLARNTSCKVVQTNQQSKCALFYFKQLPCIKPFVTSAVYPQKLTCMKIVKLKIWQHLVHILNGYLRILYRCSTCFKIQKSLFW